MITHSFNTLVQTKDPISQNRCSKGLEMWEEEKKTILFQTCMALSMDNSRKQIPKWRNELPVCCYSMPVNGVVCCVLCFVVSGHVWCTYTKL